MTDIECVAAAFDHCSAGVWQLFCEHCKRELGADWTREIKAFAESELREVLREFWDTIRPMPPAIRRAKATTCILQWAAGEEEAEAPAGTAVQVARLSSRGSARRTSMSSNASSADGTARVVPTPPIVPPPLADAPRLGTLVGGVNALEPSLPPIAPNSARGRPVSVGRGGGGGQFEFLLRSLPIFATLPPAAISSLARNVKRTTYEAGAQVFEAGTPGSAMFVVLEGSVRLIAPSGLYLAEVQQKGALGEIAVLYPNVQRQASAMGGGAGAVLGVLSKQDIDAVTSAHRCKAELMAAAQGIDYVKDWFLSSLPLFSALRGNRAFLSALAGVLESVREPAGKQVVIKGEAGTDMFFLVSGECEVLQRGRLVANILAGSYFGEKAMLYGGERISTVRAKVDCHMYRLTKADFDRILDRFPECLEAVYGRAQESKHLKEHFIRSIPLFSEMKDNAEFVLNLAMALSSRSFRGGEEVVQQHGTDTDLYVVAHGNLSVKRDGRTVGRMGSGGFFGELALVYDQPRQATVFADSPAHLYSLSQEAFETIAAAFPAWWDAISADRQSGLFSKVQGVELARVSKYHNLAVPEVRNGNASQQDLFRARMQRRAQQGTAHGPEDRLREIMDSRLCTICADKERNAVFVPCGHAACCKQCADKHIRGTRPQCVICRAPVRQVVQAYLN
eukprot:Hpha_TRINITY_DN15799_c0_g1::TRINITY_DN15799_c0_g1_i1::g.38656::m.38656